MLLYLLSADCKSKTSKLHQRNEKGMLSPPSGHADGIGGGVFLRFLLLTVLATLLGMALRRMTLLRQCGCFAPAHRLYRRAAWAVGLTVYAAMAVQEGILLLCGMLTWQTGLPLHLCSMMGLLTLPMLVTENRLLWHVSLYVGMPGALMAVLFPSVLTTPWPEATALAFHTMHCLVFLAPLLPLGLGRRPEPRGALYAGGLLLMAGLCAMGVNALLDSNYLFLGGPVPGTPLEVMARHGLTVYRLMLAGLCLLLLTAEGLLVSALSRRPLMTSR